ncbi:DNA cross-link repair 1A protein-like isoform X1 [Zootermopsis nevadensis]|uniref:DNA cross-link repair 1A protein-like isoform X1 n=1 Tax=Zootermopsis nevadensis TaxID=136037 RepID=UPI000B8EC143|nr:DNA cross-link repair 1A protein-like isoform X1 [Zootermopsis nevadensis]XP_021926729.1 DNA cross-link repair 1A protein-like isoform X1 [Zootermopsis nevadensis]XP_021926730.1 DNA cross-link repair 1A protein-like isoform X1 [Zootermopsis nevadensis]
MLLQRKSKKEVAEVPHRQMSITSYFQSSRSERSSADGGTKGVKSTNSSVVASQDSHFFKPYDLNTARKDYVGNSCDVPNHNKEFVVTHWKQLLHGMKQKGLSTMNVINDSSLTITSNSHTSASSLHSLQQYSGKKTCPYYKRIPDTSFVVDAFQYGIIPGISHYFLSHFHSDHYGGLRKSFSKPIYCSRITAALVKMKLRVDERYLHVLDLDVPQNINDVLVTSMDANHCPGSVMFLFQLQDGRNFLHVGDFRADPKMESYPCFWNSEIDKLYLDTTYCDPRYSFPVQSETITRVVELAKEHHRMVPSTLFVCGTYTLGRFYICFWMWPALAQWITSEDMTKYILKKMCMKVKH